MPRINLHYTPISTTPTNGKRKTIFALTLLILIFVSGCYSIKIKNDTRRINVQIFKNDTTIFGLENELNQSLPAAFRKETGFRIGNSDTGYVVKGQILEYKKKVIRKSTNGEPTHQQIYLVVLLEFLENGKVLNSQKIINTSYRIDSGLYNSSAGESESFGRKNALMDISESIAQTINYYFIEN